MVEDGIQLSEMFLSTVAMIVSPVHHCSSVMPPPVDLMLLLTLLRLSTWLTGHSASLCFTVEKHMS